MQIMRVEEPRKLANVLLSVNVGWSHEPVGMRGISHFLEHSVFLGSGEHPEPDMDVGKYGVMLNGETQADRTIFFFSSLPEDAEDVLGILLSLVYHPLFPPEKVEEEKESKIIPAVVKESDFYPWELAYEWARNLIFGWDFRFSMGTKEELENMNIECLQEWHKRYYHSENSLLLVSQEVEIGSSPIPQGGLKPEPQRISYSQREMVVERGIENAEIVYAFPLKNYDLRAHLLSVIWGNYPTSLFWHEFHRKAYMVESRVEWHNSQGGFFFYVGANTKNAGEIRKMFNSFIEKMKISKEDLEIAKRILTLELLERERSPYGMEYLLNIDPKMRYGGFEELLNEFRNIEVNEIRDYASGIFDLEEIRVVIVR